MRLWPGAILIISALTLCSIELPGAAVDADASDELKSVIVKNFLRYTTWPEAGSANSPLTVGVVGRSSFAQVLHGLLDGKPVNGRNVQVVELKPGTTGNCCDLVYIASDRNSDIRQALQTLRASHILTIGEADNFLDYGGAVNLLQVDGHMGFEVNLDALTRSGVEISSRLLRLGQIKRKRAE